MANSFRYSDVPAFRRALYRFLLFGILNLVFFGVLPAQTLRPGSIPDVPVIDQDGKAHRFFTDLVKGKIVAINFAYTSCQLVCPRQGRRFSELQDRLGSRLGQDIFLITVTTDPVNDTPLKLKSWASQFGAKPGWTLVTGLPTDIQQLVKSVANAQNVVSGPLTGQEGGHLPVVVMINEPRGLEKIDFSLSASYWVSRSLMNWYDPPKK